MDRYYQIRLLSAPLHFSPLSPPPSPPSGPWLVSFQRNLHFRLNWGDWESTCRYVMLTTHRLIHMNFWKSWPQKKNQKYNQSRIVVHCKRKNFRDSWIYFDQTLLGLGKLFPARESLVGSDIPAGDGNTAKPFFTLHS